MSILPSLQIRVIRGIRDSYVIGWVQVPEELSTKCGYL